MFPCLTKFLFIEVSMERRNTQIIKTIRNSTTKKKVEEIYGISSCYKVSDEDLGFERSKESYSSSKVRMMSFVVRHHRRITISQGAIKLEALSYTVRSSFFKNFHRQIGQN